MKPHLLKLQAFGPYAKSVEIDFRTLESSSSPGSASGSDLSGLFLIHGQTGAGKTSILDGLSFALFGTASGTDRTPDGLRSDFAASDLPTEAVLEFSLGADLYRATRQPNQLLKKKRGEGTTSSKSDGRLEKFNPATELWDLVSAGAKKTDEAVVGLLGMTEDQFRQVVVLPQGQFRKFLAAGSDEREDLLERLFRTERYRHIGEVLEARAKKAAAEFAEKRAEREALLTTLDVRDTEDLGEKRAKLEAEIAVGEGGQLDLMKRHAEARASLDQAREAAKLQADLRIVSDRYDLLKSHQPEQATRIAKLDAHQRAQPVLQMDLRVAAVNADFAKLALELKTAENELPEAEKALQSAEKAMSTLEARRELIEGAITRRESLRQIYEQVISLGQEKQQLTTQGSSLKALEQSESLQRRTREDLKHQRLTAESELNRLNEQILSERQIRAELELVKSRLGEARQAVVLSDSIQNFSAELSRTETSLTDLDSRLQIAQVGLKTLKLDYHRSQAALLARELRDNDPCPVCGSLDHPSPARETSSTVSLEKIESSETSLADLVAKRSPLESARVRWQTEIAQALSSLRVTAGSSALSLGEISPLIQANLKKLNSESQALELSLKEISAAAKSQALAEKRLADLTKQIESADAELKMTSDKIAEVRALTKSTEKAISDLEAKIPPEFRDLAKVKSEGVRLKEQIDAFAIEAKQITEAFNVAVQLVTRLKSAVETLNQQRSSKAVDLHKMESERDRHLQLSGFRDLESVRAAALKPEDVATTERARRDFDNDWATIQSRFNELTALTKGKSPVDESELRRRDEAFATIDQERTSQIAQGLSRKERLSSLKQTASKVESLQLRVAELERQHSVVGRLADAAAGRAPNLSRVGFQRYVLGSRLDEVLDQASRRLFKMSKGQFTLKRANKIDDKRKNAGLDLEVEDALSGTTRHTSSLSGGEGFLASLALALGLADVVQNHLGGVRLDAVFVDEGFGTLDPEALDEAMRILTDLQSGGRIVGLISHVPELRDQIARRLVITKGIEGSTVRWE